MKAPTAGSALRHLCRSAALLAAMAGVALAAPPSLDLEGAPWTFLAFQAGGLGSRVSVEVRLESLPASAQAQFMPSPRGTATRVRGDRVRKLSVSTLIEIAGRKALRLENRLWFDPASGAPLYLERTRSGLDDYSQRFRFTAEGVFRRQHEPASGREADGPPETWTRLGAHFYPYPQSVPGCAAVMETSMLICLLSGPAGWKPEAIDSLCLFHKRQLHRLSCRAEDPEPVAFDYLEKRGGVERRRSGAAAARPLRVQTRPIGSYRGDVEELFDDGARLFLSPDGGVPLMVSGSLPLIGRVDLKLREARLG